MGFDVFNIGQTEGNYDTKHQKQRKKANKVQKRLRRSSKAKKKTYTINNPEFALHEVAKRKCVLGNKILLLSLRANYLCDKHLAISEHSMPDKIASINNDF